MVTKSLIIGSDFLILKKKQIPSFNQSKTAYTDVYYHLMSGNQGGTKHKCMWQSSGLPNSNPSVVLSNTQTLTLPVTLRENRASVHGTDTVMSKGNNSSPKMPPPLLLFYSKPTKSCETEGGRRRENEQEDERGRNNGTDIFPSLSSHSVQMNDEVVLSQLLLSMQHRGPIPSPIRPYVRLLWCSWTLDQISHIQLCGCI